MAIVAFFSTTTTATISTPLRSRANPSPPPSPHFVFCNNPSNVPALPKAIKLSSSSSTICFGYSSRRTKTYPEPVLSSKTWVLRQSALACLKRDDVESEPSTASLPEATIDIKLPRRSLLVEFTCNACGDRTKRLVNRLAYERGTIFVQCAGCLKHHRLVDNLGLVVEYDFREDVSTDLNAEQNDT